MANYEKELKRLEWLMDDVATDDEPLGSEIEDEMDNVSINSDYPDMMQSDNDESEVLAVSEVPTTENFQMGSDQLVRK